MIDVAISADLVNRYGPFGLVRSTFSFMEWFEQPEVIQAWKVFSKIHNLLLDKIHNLLLDPFKDRGQTFGITDSAIIGGWALSLRMRKARKMGFHATVDSYESMFQTLHDLAKLHVASAPTQSSFLGAIQD